MFDNPPGKIDFWIGCFEVRVVHKKIRCVIPEFCIYTRIDVVAIIGYVYNVVLSRNCSQCYFGQPIVAKGSQIDGYNICLLVDNAGGLLPSCRGHPRDGFSSQKNVFKIKMSAYDFATILFVTTLVAVVWGSMFKTNDDVLYTMPRILPVEKFEIRDEGATM